MIEKTHFDNHYSTPTGRIRDGTKTNIVSFFWINFEFPTIKKTTLK